MATDHQPKTPTSVKLQNLMRTDWASLFDVHEARHKLVSRLALAKPILPCAPRSQASAGDSGAAYTDRTAKVEKLTAQPTV